MAVTELHHVTRPSALAAELDEAAACAVPMRRVVVVGISGSGKTTVAANLAARLRVPHIEMDALHHGPNWTEATAAEMRFRVEAALAAAPNGWIVDGDYGRKIGDLVLRRADTLVWIDLPLHLALV